MDVPAVVPQEPPLNLKTIASEPFRDWSVFFGKPTLPNTADDAFQRMTGARGRTSGRERAAGNVRHYLKNYAALFAFVCLFVMCRPCPCAPELAAGRMWNLWGLAVIAATFGGIYYVRRLLGPTPSRRADHHGASAGDYASRDGDLAQPAGRSRRMRCWPARPAADSGQSDRC